MTTLSSEEISELLESNSDQYQDVSMITETEAYTTLAIQNVKKFVQ